MWNDIANENDLKNFMDAMYGFHDSCIKEIKYISGAYVNEKLSMSPVNSQRILSVIIQRQFEDPSAIEMQFAGLKYLNLFPNDENYTCEILDATMIIKEDRIYWCDCGGLSEKDIESYTGTTICASKARWRAADEYLGAKEIYVTIWTEFLDFGGTSEGCYPQTEHNSTRNRFINRKHIIAYFSAIDNTLSEKEVSL